MTWRSLIFFSLSAVLLSGSLTAASVSGQIKLAGSHDAAVEKKSDFSGVAVWLETAEPSAASLHDSRKRVQMLQQNKRFSPHILIVQSGTVVDFPNLDPIFHNAFSNFNGQIFDLSLYPPGSSRKVRFTRPGIVRIFCNIHPTMSAIVVVVDSPRFTTTDSDGRYTLTNVEPGKYTLRFFHERSTPETLTQLSRQITIDAEDQTVPLIVISEAGYIPLPHKNKYGLDYPAKSEDNGTYASPIK